MFLRACMCARPRVCVHAKGIDLLGLCQTKVATNTISHKFRKLFQQQQACVLLFLYRLDRHLQGTGSLGQRS